jgi:hypothetical protein
MSINERLKFLIRELGMSARAFSIKLEVPDTTTRNYLDKSTKLNSEYLERIAHHFKEVNLNWLITGNGEPLIGQSQTPQIQTTISGDRNNVASGKNGKAIQKNYGLSDCERELAICRAQLDKAQREIELLTGQLKMQETIIQGKDQMLDLLRGGFTRPN